MVLALENIVRVAKVDPLITTAIVAVSVAVGAAVGKVLADGINPMDVPTLIASGGNAIAVKYGINLIKEQYENVGEIIEGIGFDTILNETPLLRRHARVYAQENDLMEEYNSALERQGN